MSWSSLAQETAPAADDDEKPSASGVVVRQLGDNLIEEFRAGGRTRSIRVVPQDGVPYLILDAEGDGAISEQNNRTDEAGGVTGWQIMDW